jgi:hypothetical protein
MVERKRMKRSILTLFENALLEEKAVLLVDQDQTQETKRLGNPGLMIII